MRTLRLLSVVLAIALVGVSAPAAQAGKQTTRDATRDVYRVPVGGSPTIARDNRAYDITRAGAVHRGTTLKVWLEVRRLGQAGYVATWDVKTPDDRWALHYDTRDGADYPSVFHGPGEVDCPGIQGQALHGMDRVVVTVPRACIGRPRWVRWGASMGRETNKVHFIDDARLDGSFYSYKCKLGPRVRHN